MADLSFARQLPPRGTSSIYLNKSSSKPSLKTYSKRSLQYSSAPPRKRQRIELPTTSVECTTKSGVQLSTPTRPKKRSISDYFKAVAHTRTPSSPQSSIFSSDPVKKNVESPPSSPPSPHTSPSVALQKTRTRRRLTARPPLGVIKMSDLNVGGSKEHREGTGKRIADKGPFYPGSPPRTPYLTKTSPPGLRQAARGGTSSEEEEGGLAGEDKVYHGRDVTPRSDPIDIPGARIHRPEDLVIPFAPQRPYTFRDSGFGTVQPSSATPVNRQITFSSADTLVEGSTPSRQMTFGSANTMVAGASTAREMTFSRQSIEDFGRTDVLHATQSDDPDMIFGMGDEITERNDIPVSGASLITVVARSGAGPQLMGNPTQIPANLINPEASIQSHVTGPADAQAPINSAAAGVIQLNIPAASNVAQGSGNLVQAQLDIGRPTNLMCNICRFTFNRTVLADARAHSQYHDSHTLGEPIIGLTTTSRYHLRRIETGIGEGDYVVMVDRSSTQGWKDVAMAVLETHVDRELNSVAISASRLWSSIADPAITGRNSEANPVDRYKVYMYVRRYQPKLGRVVSLLLAERITTGFETNRIQIQADEFGAWPSIVRNVQTVVSTKAHEAVLGINKFWTISNSRRNGYGRVLLNQARQNFLPYYIIPRIHIAWTYTTDDGANFAKAYLQGQTDYDYLTYDDHV